MSNILWEPGDDRAHESEMARFRAYFAHETGADLSDTEALTTRALEDPARFWSALWDFFHVIGDKGDGPYLVGEDMASSDFFPNATLNFAENLLHLARPDDGRRDALVFRGEDKSALRWSWDDLEAHVSRLQLALRAAGVGPGDRVAGLLPNRPEAVAAMLATASLGAVWASASPDFGPRVILDRFGQIAPKVLFACDGYWYAGKPFAIADKLAETMAGLETVKACVIIDYLGTAEATAAALPKATSFDAFEAAFEAQPCEFVPMPFNHPLYVTFSSGTTGAPKCIVHRAGGVLLQHLKEHALHVDLRPGDRMFYFTTLGWMMWNWLVSGLARGATLLLFDGSPFHPGPGVLFDYARDERMTQFGTSPRYLDGLRSAGFAPGPDHNLSALRTMLSTGAPLLGEAYDYVYQVLKPDLHLASISGGTDILSCFVLGDPTRPVARGVIQSAGLGLAVEVWSDAGKPVVPGEKGELVCTKPFPTMPLGFWNDAGCARYRAAYFDRFPGVWCQGDFAEQIDGGGYVIHGRSDATLNPGGVRIGTAEIYAEVGRFAQIEEAVVVGQSTGDDVRVVLCVVMGAGAVLDDGLIREIKTAIRRGASPRHVPALILAVTDIPRTKSGKVSELAVRDVIEGRAAKNIGALANPEALEAFRDIAPLTT
ncbi:acetoacetate--CoA ligase [Celeribacter neptunius]|uniref:Acetoacetyl-CoA synthetase n=1 Tax=Celeribacter neptunius TaxID=588602 RepID=A0A1I3S3G4_9RHOB|nr:acetoacetate--CoA ligase [Celeribacter neptunius]SFJ53168.1 acetoacetyl-CoA synthetase [Celeribacter neptunius]